MGRLLAVLAAAPPAAPAPAAPPREAAPLIRAGQLDVGGEPLVIPGGELQSITATGTACMAPARVRVEQSGFNTVLAKIG